MLRHLCRFGLNKNKVSKRINDVTVGVHDKIVVLKEDTLLSVVLNYFKDNKFSTSLISIGFLFLIISFFASLSYASVSKLYSNSCLGGWQNTSKAEGKPNVEDGVSFSLDNSAVLDNKISQIFCGRFRGDVPEDTEPKKVYIAFSWGTENTKKEIETIKISGENFASSTNQIIDLPQEGPSQFELLPSNSSQSTTTDKINSSEPSTPGTVSESEIKIETEPPLNQSQEPSTEPNSTESEPTSWLFKTVHADESTSTETVFNEGLLEIKYTIDGENWNSLGKVNRNALHNTRFELPLGAISGWLDVSRLQVSIESLPSLNEEPKIYLDSVWVEVEYDKLELLSKLEINQLPRVNVDDREIFDPKVNSFQSNKEAEFEINITEPEAISTSTNNIATTTIESVTEPPTSMLIKSVFAINSTIKNFADFFSFKKAIAQTVPVEKILDAEIISPDGSNYDEKPIIEQNSSLAVIKLPKTSREFVPGIYKLKVEILSNGKVLVTTKEFAWGVLAINTDQSSYLPGEKVYLQIGALDKIGHTLCDANLKLEINGAVVPIKKSDTCGEDNVTDNPDYYAIYTSGESGIYDVKLKNLDTGFSIKDSFEVSAGKPFIIERSGATRINPYKSSYTMKLNVRAQSVFHGHITETVPEGFMISTSSPNAYIETIGGVTNLIWNVNLLPGNNLSLEYTYNAPQLSPELFTLGPVALESLGQNIYTEERSWQLASDAAFVASATGNWNVGTTWGGACASGCVEGTDYPGINDSATINSGVTVTVTANASSSVITIAANSNASLTNGININSGVTLAVTGTVALTAPTTLTSTLAVGAGNLNAGAINIPGSATAGRFATVSVSTGSIKVPGSITFSGTAAQARFISTGASTVTVGGNFSSGGTLTTSNTGTIIFNGTGSQTMGTYTTYNNVEINGVGNTVTPSATNTINGNFTITNGQFSIATAILTVTGTTSVSGTITFTGAAGAKTFNGSVTINNGGVWNETTSAIPTFSNGLTNNGTFTASTGVHTFSTNAQAINGSAISIPSITITTVTVTSNVDLTVGTALSGTGGLTMAANKTLTVGGTTGITALTVNNSGVVVNYNGTSAQTIKATTYITLKVNNTNASGATLGGALTLTTLTIGDVSASSIFSDGGFVITLAGSSVLNLTQGTYKLGSATVGTSFPSYGTINISSGTTVEYASAVSQTISSTPTYYSLTVSGGVNKSIDFNLSLAGNLTINTSGFTVDLGTSRTDTISGSIVVTAGTLNASNSSLSFAGSLSGAGTFNGNTGTITFTGSSAQTLGATTQTFNNITLNKSASSNTVTMTAAVTLNGTLNVTVGTFSIGAFAFTHNGTTSVSANQTINITSSTGTKIFTGLVTNAGTWNNSGNSAITFRGGINNSGTFTGGTGVQTFDTNNQSVSGNSVVTMGSVTVTTITLTNSNTAGFTISTTLAGTGGITQDTNSPILNIGAAVASLTITTLTTSATGNTVNYTGAAQTVRLITYHHLGLSGSGAKTLTSVATINGDFNMSGTCTASTAIGLTVGGNVSITGTAALTVGAFDFTVNGTTTINGGTLAHSSATGIKTYKGLVTLTTGTWSNAGNSAINYRGGLTVNGGTFTSGTGVYTFDTNNQSVSGSSAITISSVTVTTITLTNSNTAGFTISTTLAGTGGITQDTNSPILNIGAATASFTLSTLTASASGNIVNYNGTSAQTIKAITYSTLKSNNTVGATLGGATTLNTLTIGDITASSIFDDGGFVITLSGSSVLNLTQGTYKLGSASVGTSFPSYGTINISSGTTVQYQSAVAQTVSSVPSYQNITFIGVGTKTVNGGLNVAGSLTVNASSQTVDLVSYSHTITGNIVITLGTLNANSSSINLVGNLSGAGTFTGGTSNLTFTGGGTQTFGVTTQTYNNVAVSKTVGTGVSVSVAGTIGGTLNINSGTFTVGAFAETVTGTTTVANTGTLTLSSATGAKTFGPVIINNGGTWSETAAAIPTFKGGITVDSGGTFTASTGIHTFSTNDQSIGNGAALTIPTVVVTTIILTNNNTAGFTISTSFSGTGGLTQGTNAVLNLTGTYSTGTLTTSATGNTVNYNGVTQTPRNNTYYNLVLSGSGTKTISGTVITNGDFTVSGTTGVTFTGSLNTTGNFNISSGTNFVVSTGASNLNITSTTTIDGTFQLSATSGVTPTFTGRVVINNGSTWNNSGNINSTFMGGLTFYSGGTFTSGTGTYLFNTNNQTVEGTGILSISNVTVNGITLTNNNSVGFTIGTALSGTGGLTQGTNSILNIGGTSSGITTFTTSATGNTVKYTSTTASQTIRAPSSSGDYYNLTIDNSTQVASIDAVTRVDGDLTITPGATLSSGVSGFGLRVGGNWTNNGTFSGGAGAHITFNGTGNQTITGSDSWNDFTISNAGVARTIYFAAGSTQTILANGSLTFSGSVGNTLTLAPLTPASSWGLRINNTGVIQSISYVNVSYSNAGTLGVDAEVSAYNGTNTDGGNNTNWNFVGNVSFSISDNSIGFGTLSASTARYATGDTTGTSSPVIAHTLTAAGPVSGYSIFVQGDSLKCGNYQIDPIGSINTPSSVGTEQFGIHVSASGGSGTVTAPYAAFDYAYNASSTTSKQVASASFQDSGTTYSVYYLGNISATTENCNYSSNLSYIMVPNF